MTGTQAYRFLGPDCFLAALSSDFWTAFWTASALPGESGTPDHMRIAPQSILALLLLRMQIKLGRDVGGCLGRAAFFL
jgi:hypothetical protein